MDSEARPPTGGPQAHQPTARDCQLTRAARFEVELSGATIIVLATGVEAPPGWRGTIELVSEGWTVRLRLMACRADGGAPGRQDVRATFALAAAPASVLIEHADGESRHVFRAPKPIQDVQVPRGAPPPPMALPEPEPEPEPMARPEPAPMARPEMTPTARPRQIPAPAPAEAAPPEPEPTMAAPPRGPRLRIPRIGLDWLRAPRRGLESKPPPSTERGPTAAPSPAPADATGESGLYARIDSPDRFVVEEPQRVVIGVRPDPDPQVIDVELRLPETVGERFILSAQFVAEGFRLADDDGSWHTDLAVTPDQPYPWRELTLVAEPIEGDLKIRRLRVVYSIAGQVIGIAERPVAVVARSETAVPPLEAAGFAARQAMAVPVSEHPADLTVVILQDPEGERGHLLWAFSTPHKDVDVPRGDLMTDIGHSPQEFANAVRIQVEVAEATPGQPLLRETLVGIGNLIASKFPAPFWTLLAGVASRTGGRPPSLLILSQEPYVPWELAVPAAPLNPAMPPFLGAQAVTGRWVFGQDKPKMPPPDSVAMRRMAVVYGDYAGAAHLEDAIAEKSSLETSYDALPVRATLPAMQALLRGEPGGEVLHFAIHGRYSTGASGGLLMEDGATLSSFAVGGSQLSAAPLVFLNACQVGAGTQLLGDYAGMAEAFLRAGASAVIAPLWSVRDGAAKEIALRFYPEALAGALPAELLRRERASFGAHGDPETATNLAYLFYGHPTFRLTRAL